MTDASSLENKNCVYCGDSATTMDHVPPRTLFQKPRPELITVPSCSSCNNDPSKDDEYFRNLLLTDDRIRDHPEAKGLIEAYTRSLKRPQATGLRAAMLRDTTRFPLISPAGIIYGEGTGLKSDFTRERKVLERVTKGLFYHEFQTPHPNENSISVYSTRHMDEGRKGLNTVLEFISYIKPENKKTIGNDVFSYGYAIAEDHPDGSFWVLTFFKTIPFFVFSIPPAPIGQ